MQYLPTSAMVDGTTPVEETPAGRRAVVDGIVLSVDDDGVATLLLPAGRRVVVNTVAT